MKIYYHPVSTVSRPVMLFAADEGLQLDYEVVDLFTGEHLGDKYAAINPSCQVPVLEDGDFRLTESSAILKYLAEKSGSAAYPSELKARARVNERMDWLNTGLYRDLGYGFIYPQVFPHHKRADEQVTTGTVAWGRDKSKKWLKVLDENVIGPNSYLCGNQISLADYLGVGILTVGEVVKIDYSAYPNVTRWIKKMKSSPNWDKVNEAFYAHFVSPFAQAQFAAL